MSHKLKDGAIFIADAHYPNHHSKDFINILEAIYQDKISAPQLFLMGDIFDLLVGNSPYLKKRFKKEIELIENISNKVKVFYIEGNHDFNLKPLFKNVKIIPIEKQPLILEYNNKKIALSHGDKYNSKLSYKIYTKFIRNPFIIKIIPQGYAKYKLKKMKSKKLCKKIDNFKDIVKKIVNNYTTDLIIEGHFHQGVRVGHYIALPSFACKKEYAIFNNFNIEFKTMEITLSSKCE